MLPGQQGAAAGAGAATAAGAGAAAVATICCTGSFFLFDGDLGAILFDRYFTDGSFVDEL